MTIKVQCGCGTRYAFDVDPVNGAMPFKVNCPACNADGTEAANQIIAQTPQEEQKTQPRLRMQAATASAASAVAPLPVPGQFVSKSVEKVRADAAQFRRTGWIFVAILVAIVLLLAGWASLSIFGSKPRLAYTMKLPGDSQWHSQFVDDGKILLASANRVILHDLHNDRNLWSTAIAGEADEFRLPDVLVAKGNVWVCAGDGVVRLDEKTGELKQTIPITGRFRSFTPTDSSILVVSEVSQTRTAAMRIDLATDEVSTQQITIPRALVHATPDELPANVAPTADVLVAQATEQIKFSKTLDAMSSEIFSTGQNLVELRVKLLEPIVNWVQAIKPRGPSVINGNTTASTSIGSVEEEVFNDIKRSKTGGVKPVDESRYEVKLRRWIADKPVEWEGEVKGLPQFFPLQTVDLLTAGKTLQVFDKQNNKLFETQLSYPISGQFEESAVTHLKPAVERGGVLYFFDQGVLGAFSLPGGEVKWRLPSIGISRLQFDDKGFLYVDTTAASPEDIQYSEQIKFESTPPVILKVDPATGKILWQAQGLGQSCYLSGKYLYVTSAAHGGMGMLNGLAEAVNSPQRNGRATYHVYRLDPETGDELWSFYRDSVPEEELFQKNWYLLRYGNEIRAYKFMAFF